MCIIMALLQPDPQLLSEGKVALTSLKYPSFKEISILNALWWNLGLFGQSPPPMLIKCKSTTGDSFPLTLGLDVSSALCGSSEPRADSLSSCVM